MNINSMAEIVFKIITAFLTLYSFWKALIEPRSFGRWMLFIFTLSVCTYLFVPESLINDDQPLTESVTPTPTDAPNRLEKTQEFINRVENVYKMVYYGDFVYGDSKSSPPCADGTISGDRMIARALWDMGFTDQPTGGITYGAFETYLPKHGFEVITDKSQLKAGDIVQVTVYDRPDGKVVDYSFVLVSYDPETEYCSKYDLSLNTLDGRSRLDCIQPFTDVPLEENGEMRVFKQAFRIK